MTGEVIVAVGISLWPSGPWPCVVLQGCIWSRRTLPTAASPSRTSFTLLLGFGAVAVDSAMIFFGVSWYSLRFGRSRR